MHQVFLQTCVREEHVFVKSILFLVVLGHLFLRHYLQNEIYELYPQVRVVDPSVQDDGYASCQLHMHVLVEAYVALGHEHFEEFRH